MKRNWEYKKLGDVCTDVTDFVAAGSFANLRKNVVYNSEQDYAQLIRTTDLKRKFLNNDFVYVSKSAFEYLWRVNLDKACVVLPNVGNCGEVYYVSPEMLPYKNNVLAPNSILVRSYTENQRFLAYAFQGLDFQLQLKTITGTVAQPKFNKTNLKNLIIPIPPLDEQSRIVAELDLLTGIIDKQNTQLKELDNLAQAIFYDMFGDPIENPKGWEVKKFDELCVLITDGEHATPKRCASGIYLLSARNVHNHHLVLDDVDFIDDEEYSRISKRIVPQKGDVLISCSGSVGRVCVAPDIKFQMVRSVALLRLDETRLNTRFFEYLVCSDYVQKQIDDSKVQVAQANLFQGRIKALKGILPPLALQQSFAEKIQSIEKQKEAIRASIADTQKLLDYTMDKYFG